MTTQLLEALEPILEFAQCHVNVYHQAMEGYRESEHAAMDKAMEVAHAAIAAHKAQSDGWRPISEAPMDGTVVLVFENYSETVGAACYVDGGWFWESDYRYAITHPIRSVTHFQHLPAPPKD
jgi:hypothetical protein